MASKSIEEICSKKDGKSSVLKDRSKGPVDTKILIWFKELKTMNVHHLETLKNSGI